VPRAWVVLIEEDMISRWVFYSRVPPEDQQVVRAWIQDLEESGPPAIVAYSPGGSPIARVGDTDMRVEFEVVATPLGFATPPYGLIKVYEIFGRGSTDPDWTDPDDFAE
jgi:hypothetical protein